MSQWSGQKDSGSAAYTPADVARVVAILGRCDAPERAIPVADLTTLAQVSPRTLRAILSDLDGERFVLAFAHDGAIYRANTYDETVPYSRKLGAQIRTMNARLEKRRAYAARHLPTTQGGLF